MGDSYGINNIPSNRIGITQSDKQSPSAQWCSPKWRCKTLLIVVDLYIKKLLYIYMYNIYTYRYTYIYTYTLYIYVRIIYCGNFKKDRLR